MKIKKVEEDMLWSRHDNICIVGLRENKYAIKYMDNKICKFPISLRHNRIHILESLKCSIGIILVRVVLLVNAI